MKKHLIAFAVAALAAGGVMAQANDTIAKVKGSGVITMGVRDSSGALSYTLGQGTSRSLTPLSWKKYASWSRPTRASLRLPN